jgi:hypothetical protein
MDNITDLRKNSNVFIESSDLLERYLGVENWKFRSKLIIIDQNNISIMNSVSVFNSIFNEFYGQMYHNFVLIRKFIYSNHEYLTKLLSVLMKIVHPSVQIFYGIMFTDESETLKKFNFNCVLEYFNGINLSNFDFLSSFMKPKEEKYIKLILADKIAQTMSFIYKSGYPHLMINGRNILINHYLIINRHQHEKFIYSDNPYIFANIIKIIEIGSFLKYDKKHKIFNLHNEDLYEISFHSPELIKYLTNKTETFMEMNLSSLEKYDIWSFGCLLLQLISGRRPFESSYDKQSLIETLLKLDEKNDFCLHNKELLSTINESYDEVISSMLLNLIKQCTTTKIEARFTFDNVISTIQTILKIFKEKNFSEEEVKCVKKKVEENDLEYFDFKIFEDSNNLMNNIRQSDEIKIKIKMLESEINDLEKENNTNQQELEILKMKKQFNTKEGSMNLTSKNNLNFLIMTEGQDFTWGDKGKIF